MFDFLNKCIDTLFPKRHDASLVDHAHQDALIDFNKSTYNNCTSLLPFQNKLVRACIHEAKFHANKKAVSLLSQPLRSYLSPISVETVLVPIPLSRARLRARGYNQVEIIATEATQNLERYVIEKDILERTRDTTPQTKLTKEERLVNVADAFGVRDSDAHKTKGKHIILLDDVITTGATMRAAKAALLTHAPASVTCIALAH